ncbi:unnamed protein product [Meloidogyne enterolobii]|uniref:Uncharacterized protein n=1 Tax=Meloidogyne enterolobii TaxID=390850 RepID=A0ACB0XL79_MELEN
MTTKSPKSDLFGQSYDRWAGGMSELLGEFEIHHLRWIFLYFRNTKYSTRIPYNLY